ncbi:hypothetical protein CkaCkLH20_00418 [Colletotrichum karsti]|uniref:Uncharacterized protein n=1 Tax=Colletotrichum karsti TaxID=1095194 RepID=A0A9P6IGY8_9PEZI|nr:uncharacterized protein CkaCkLH20_00418 [Colletotrichum karsti]KAF9882382.1 hypothetical protein CkaCkLH20_00418 [Colletotrichum karsti]
MEDDSSSEEAPESPFTPPGPIPNPIVYQNRLEPQSGTPTPRNASASESRDTSGNLPQFPTLEPTPITAIDIQNALAGFVNSDDNDDDDRTPIAQQPSAPIAQQPSTPPFPDPDSPTLRIYKTEPPRTGPGFNGSVAPVPPPDAHNRSHIWIRPHRIPEDEEFMIPTEYNDLFTLTDATRESMMPRTHRYPDYARDEEARRRKLDFEAKTGETMSDEDYYSLFDQTTSTGGMLSTLLEFMQGREYVKAAHVNRIIHQMNRMMYESAQEEARLRHRRKLECDSLRRQLKDSEERCSDLRKTVGFIKGRTTALGEVASSSKRISEISEKEDDHIRENMGHWVDSDGASARVEEDFRKWQVLDNNLMSRLDERQQIEDTIEDERSISAEDLVRLRDADATIEKQRKEFQKWMEHRTKNLIEWLEVNDDDDESEAKAVLNGIHQELVKEGKILNQAYDSLKSVAGLQLSQRELRNRPLIDVSEQVPSDQALSDSNIYEDSLGADPDTPRQVSPSSLEDDSEGSTSEKSDATVVAPREDADCAGCRRRDRQLREKDRKIQEQTNQLRVGFHNWTQLSRKAEQLRLALTRCNNDSIEDALRHITNYRTLIFRDFYDEMAHLERIFNMQVDRAEEHAALFIKPIEHLQEGGGPEEILKQLEAMGSSVESLADASRVVQQKFSDQLKKMWSEHKEKFYEVTQENVDDAQRQRDLIKNLKKQVAELTEHAQGSLEHDAQESFRVAAALEKQMKAKIGQIRDKVQRYRDEIRRQQKQCDADQSSTQSADPEVARELKKKEKELRNLDRQCTKAAQLIGRMETDLENAKELANVRKQDASVLAEQVADLQLQLEERDETERWSLWDGTAVDVTDTSDPETLRRSRVAQLQKALLEAVGKVENRAQSQATVKPRVPSVTKRMRSLVVQKIRKSEQKDSTATTEEDIDGFWRLVDFQRRRADVVSLLRRNQFQHAKEQLCELEKWNHSRGKWHVESYAVEVSRSLNYLQAYANVKLVPVQRQADVLDVANETLESAKSHFVAAERGNPDAEHERVWMALRSHLEFEVQKTVEEIQKCDCKHKTQACGKHEENGAGVRYHHFMTVDGEDGEIQLPESAFNSLDPYSYRLDTIAEE